MFVYIAVEGATFALIKIGAVEHRQETALDMLGKGSDPRSAALLAGSVSGTGIPIDQAFGRPSEERHSSAAAVWNRLGISMLGDEKEVAGARSAVILTLLILLQLFFILPCLQTLHLSMFVGSRVF